MSKTTEERRVQTTFWKGLSLAFKRIKGKERVVLWNLQNWCYLFKIVQTRSTTMNASSIFIVRLHYHNHSSISEFYSFPFTLQKMEEFFLKCFSCPQFPWGEIPFAFQLSSLQLFLLCLRLLPTYNYRRSQRDSSALCSCNGHPDQLW